MAMTSAWCTKSATLDMDADGPDEAEQLASDGETICRLTFGRPFVGACRARAAAPSIRPLGRAGAGTSGN
jgi:hypothetical protein